MSCIINRSDNKAKRIITFQLKRKPTFMRIPRKQGDIEFLRKAFEGQRPWLRLKC